MDSDIIKSVSFKDSKLPHPTTSMEVEESSQNEETKKYEEQNLTTTTVQPPSSFHDGNNNHEENNENEDNPPTKKMRKEKSSKGKIFLSADLYRSITSHIGLILKSKVIYYIFYLILIIIS